MFIRKQSKHDKIKSKESLQKKSKIQKLKNQIQIKKTDDLCKHYMNHKINTCVNTNLIVQTMNHETKKTGHI